MKETFMLRAIELAKNGIQEGDGGPFGAVVVKDGLIIGEGWNQVLSRPDPTAHGEVMAIRDASRRMGTHNLEGCHIYTTGEPCPMCLGAIYWARIERIYYGFGIEDAASAGFDDVRFHEELLKTPDKRSVPSLQICRSAALKLLEAYEKKSNKELY